MSCVRAGDGYEAAGIYQPYRWCCGNLAACGAGAAGSNARCWLPQFLLARRGRIQGGSVPTYNELLQAIYTGAQAPTRQGAGFFMLPAAFKNIAGLVDTTGQPIFSFGAVPNNIPQMLGGYPVYIVSSLSSAQTTATTTETTTAPFHL